jgi:hypothetical protein
VNLLEALRGGRKSFVQPPFWESDAARFALFGGYGGTADREKIENDFVGYAMGAFKDVPVVFGAFERRRQVFSQANFMWQRMKSGRGTDLFSTPDSPLDLLRTPWPNGALTDLLSHMANDSGIAGNFYATTVDDRGRIGRAARGNRRIARLRPDWVTIVIGVPGQPDADPNSVEAQVLMYEYKPPTTGRERIPAEPLQLLPAEVVHFAPIPDPTARFRGMSWLTPVIRDVMGDKAATALKLRRFENGGVHSLALKYPPGTTVDQLKQYKAIYDSEYRGTDNAWNTLHIGGADPIPLSANLRDLDFKAVQGQGETRIAVDSGVPAAILGISEGLSGSSLNAGNFQAARRLFVDTTIRDMWACAAPSLQVLFPQPDSGARLWYDDRDIPFLREDAADDAEIHSKDAQTVKTLVEAGYKPDAAVKYVQTGDLGSLTGQHTGRVSVQLQDMNTPPATNGTADGSASNGRSSGIENLARR